MTHPNARADVSNAARLIASTKNNRAMATQIDVLSNAVITTQPRGSMRSEITPNMGDNRKVGASRMALVTPTHKGDSVTSHTLQPIRKRAIQIPRVAKLVAMK